MYTKRLQVYYKPASLLLIWLLVWWVGNPLFLCFFPVCVEGLRKQWPAGSRALFLPWFIFEVKKKKSKFFSSFQEQQQKNQFPKKETWFYTPSWKQGVNWSIIKIWVGFFFLKESRVWYSLGGFWGKRKVNCKLKSPNGATNCEAGTSFWWQTSLDWISRALLLLLLKGRERLDPWSDLNSDVLKAYHTLNHDQLKFPQYWAHSTATSIVQVKATMAFFISNIISSLRNPARSRGEVINFGEWIIASWTCQGWHFMIHQVYGITCTRVILLKWISLLWLCFWGYWAFSC